MDAVILATDNNGRCLGSRFSMRLYKLPASLRKDILPFNMDQYRTHRYAALCSP